MKIGIILFLGFVILSHVLVAQEIYLNPQPHEMVQQEGSLALPSSIRLVGEEEAAPNAVREIRELLGNRIGKKGFRLYIGDRNTKAVRKFRRMIPDRPEGYYLAVKEDQIVVAGYDKRGTFYAVQTLKQLLRNGLSSDSLRTCLSLVEIRDYPDVPLRGVVEGFYGTPWSQEARISQLAFYGANKMNTYIFGPKNDPYHSTPKWRLPYPEKEAEMIRKLIGMAHDHEVDFVWAIHPGRDIQWNEEDRDKVIEKFQSMYGLGVRSFAVFFDDISGKGTDADRQVELLNYIDEHFIREHQDVKPLMMCPTQYNRSRWKPETHYLTTLGTRLNPTVRIMWTGDRAVSDITAVNLKWVKGLIRRPAFVWWNFPVSDYVGDALLMGPAYGVEKGIKQEVSGFVANPMQHAEASKVALYGVADYTWNMGNYDSLRAWENAIRVLIPDASGAMQIFCRHSADPGKEHSYRRSESAEIQPLLERITRMFLQKGEYVSGDFQVLKDEFSRMNEAADLLLASKSNPSLIKEMYPWLLHFGFLAQIGNETICLTEALQKDDEELFKRKYEHIRALQLRSREVDRTMGRVKAGASVLKPFIQDLFVVVTRRFNDKFHTGYVSDF